MISFIPGSYFPVINKKPKKIYIFSISGYWGIFVLIDKKNYQLKAIFISKKTPNNLKEH